MEAQSVNDCVPHPEVVNRHPSVLIVGYGHVGQQMNRWFPDAHHVDLDGVIRNPGGLPVLKAHGIYDLGFICVPTPARADGRCDLGCVGAAFVTWHNRARYWCIKSTIEVGTTERYGGDVCFSPELYGETIGHPLRDVLPFVILGGPREVTNAFATAWTLVTNSELRIYQTDSRTAELCKLMENSWLATQVSFCNQFYDLAKLAGVDYHELRELWLADPRMPRTHTYVYPDNRGFGGKCLPKDTANLCAWSRDKGQPAELIEAVREYNRRLRAK